MAHRLNPWKQFFKIKFYRDLIRQISEDHIANGAATLAYYLMLAFFPAIIFVLSLLPYLPIEHLHSTAMEFISSALPNASAQAVESAVREVTAQRHSGILSFGAVLTVWAASAGLVAIMQQLNLTYDVKEARPWWKTRILALALTILFALLLVAALAMIVFGGSVMQWMQLHYGWGISLVIAAQVFRWLMILFIMFLSFALVFYFGPNVKQRFRLITPGALIGVFLFIVVSTVFRIYVERFTNYSATYGSLAAIIILMLWFYIAGLAILLGSEINALAEKREHRLNQKTKNLRTIT